MGRLPSEPIYPNTHIRKVTDHFYNHQKNQTGLVCLSSAALTQRHMKNLTTQPVELTNLDYLPKLHLRVESTHLSLLNFNENHPPSAWSPLLACLSALSTRLLLTDQRPELAILQG